MSCAHVVEDSFPKTQQKLIFLNIVPDESSELRCILLRNMQSLMNASMEWAHYTEAMCPKSEVDKKASHLCFSSKGKLTNMSRNNPEHLSPREYRFSKGQCSSCQGNFPGRSELVPPHSLLLSLGTYSPNFPKCLKSKQWLHFNAKCTPIRGTSKLGF